MRLGSIATFLAGATALVAAVPSSGAPFADLGAPLVGVNNGDVEWGDYDMDGDLDLALTGSSNSGPVTIVYRNDAGAFAIGATLTGLGRSDVAWGDYDGDGDLDLAAVGLSATGERAIVYRNSGGTFVDIGAVLQGVRDASVAWGDFDFDGDLDLLYSGENGSGRLTLLYRNAGGNFVDAGIPLQGLTNGEVAWGDFDNDGLLDFAISGYSGTSYETAINKNYGVGFSNVAPGLTDTGFGAVAWGDYDNDGDLDLLSVGYVDPQSVSIVYRNDGGAFTDIGAALTGISGDAEWGDYDNDGDLDIVMSGVTTSGQGVSLVYRNDNGSFTDIGAGLVPTVGGSGCAWGDFDNDGDLDLALIGAASPRVARIYRNDGAVHNTPPQAPTNLSSTPVCGSQAFLNWDSSLDAQTSSPGLTYNVRVGTTPGGSQIQSAMAGTSGTRRVQELGNANHRTTEQLVLFPGRYYWSVQAVDAAFAGSPFAAEQVLDVGPPVDGLMEDTVYPAAFAVQQVQTQFGDNTLGQIDFANGSELDQALATFTGNTLYLLLAGNLESNFNKLEIFFDTKPGGQNRLRGNNPDVDTDGLNRMGDDGSGNGLTFDPGFAPDYYVCITGGDSGDGTYELQAYWAELLTNGGGVGRMLGRGGAGGCGLLADGTNPDGILASIDNVNTAGVGAGTGAASGVGVTTGVELGLPLAALGNPTGCIRVSAFVDGVRHDFVSNQVLGSFTPPQAFLGEPRNLDFGALAGEQFFSLCSPYLGVEDRVSEPTLLRLAPMGPNPMRNETLVWFELPRAQTIALEVFDVQGARRCTLKKGRVEAGAHRVMWKGADDGGEALPNGVYFFQLRGEAASAARRVTIVR